MTVSLYKVLDSWNVSSPFPQKGVEFKNGFFSQETGPPGAYIQRGTQSLVQFEFKFLPSCV